MYKIICNICILCLVMFISSCEEKLSEEDVKSYKEIMDIRLGHLGNAIIMQGRLLDSFNLSNARADEDHFKEAEELIKGHLSNLGSPVELKSLDIPNVKKIREMHSSIIEASETMISAINMLEDQAWLGGSVGYAESATEKARFNFQKVVKTIYNLSENVKPITEPNEYDVGQKPKQIDLD